MPERWESSLWLAIFLLPALALPTADASTVTRSEATLDVTSSDGLEATYERQTCMQADFIAGSSEVGGASVGVGFRGNIKVVTQNLKSWDVELSTTAGVNVGFGIKPFYLNLYGDISVSGGFKIDPVLAYKALHHDVVGFDTDHKNKPVEQHLLAPLVYRFILSKLKDRLLSSSKAAGTSEQLRGILDEFRVEELKDADLSVRRDLLKQLRRLEEEKREVEQQVKSTMLSSQSSDAYKLGHAQRQATTRLRSKIALTQARIQNSLMFAKDLSEGHADLLHKFAEKVFDWTKDVTGIKHVTSLRAFYERVFELWCEVFANAQPKEVLSRDCDDSIYHTNGRLDLIRHLECRIMRSVDTDMVKAIPALYGDLGPTADERMTLTGMEAQLKKAGFLAQETVLHRIIMRFREQWNPKELLGEQPQTAEISEAVRMEQYAMVEAWISHQTVTTILVGANKEENLKLLAKSIEEAAGLNDYSFITFNKLKVTGSLGVSFGDAIGFCSRFNIIQYARGGSWEWNKNTRQLVDAGSSSTATLVVSESFAYEYAKSTNADKSKEISHTITAMFPVDSDTWELDPQKPPAAVECSNVWDTLKTAEDPVDWVKKLLVNEKLSKCFSEAGAWVKEQVPALELDTKETAKRIAAAVIGTAGELAGLTVKRSSTLSLSLKYSVKKPHAAAGADAAEQTSAITCSLAHKKKTQISATIPLGPPGTFSVKIAGDYWEGKTFSFVPKQSGPSLKQEVDEVIAAHKGTHVLRRAESEGNWAGVISRGLVDGKYEVTWDDTSTTEEVDPDAIMYADCAGAEIGSIVWVWDTKADGGSYCRATVKAEDDKVFTVEYSTEDGCFKDGKTSKVLSSNVYC